MPNIIQMKDSDNQVFYPQTHEKAVIDSYGVPLNTKLDTLTNSTYITAWDGASTPVPANIPVGVAVTYNGTSYTGSLAASSATMYKQYLVADTSNPGQSLRYVTSKNGNSYSWVSYGTTEMAGGGDVYIGDTIESNVTISGL